MRRAGDEGEGQASCEGGARARVRFMGDRSITREKMLLPVESFIPPPPPPSRVCPVRCARALVPELRPLISRCGALYRQVGSANMRSLYYVV